MKKKVWFEENGVFNCYVANSPYNQESIIKQGVSYNEWIKLETHPNGYESTDATKCNRKRMKK